MDDGGCLTGLLFGHRQFIGLQKLTPVTRRHWVYLGSDRGRKLAHAQMAHDCRLGSSEHRLKGRVRVRMGK